LVGALRPVRPVAVAASVRDRAVERLRLVGVARRAVGVLAEPARVRLVARGARRVALRRGRGLRSVTRAARRLLRRRVRLAVALPALGVSRTYGLRRVVVAARAERAPRACERELRVRAMARGARDVLRVERVLALRL